MSCLFLVGSARSFFTGKNALRSGLEMTLVGSVVAVITYGVGYFFPDCLTVLSKLLAGDVSATERDQHDPARRGQEDGLAVLR